jgi:alanine dehydrogenase
VTLILTGTDVAALLEIDETLRALRSGFLAAASARGPEESARGPGASDRGPGASDRGLRVRTDLPAAGTATVLLPGLLPGIPAYTVKINAKFPGAVPALRGVVCLHSLDDGRLLAILDSASLTAWRTGLAAALATDVLAAPGAAALGVVGAGAQADLVLAGLSRLRALTRLTVTDLDPSRARRFAERFAERHGGPGGPGSPAVQPAGSAREVADASDIVLLATWSRAPLLALGDLRPGQHVTSLGPDEPGKCELAADVFHAATVVVDDQDLAREAGALAPETLRDVRAVTFGDVLAGRHPGRRDPGDLTVYAPVGLPWQDLAAAWLAYQAAAARGGGLHVDLLA